MSLNVRYCEMGWSELVIRLRVWPLHADSSNDAILKPNSQQIVQLIPSAALHFTKNKRFAQLKNLKIGCPNFWVSLSVKLVENKTKFEYSPLLLPVSFSFTSLVVEQMQKFSVTIYNNCYKDQRLTLCILPQSRQWRFRSWTQADCLQDGIFLMDY